ncbi:peptide-methionine (S)-S-oxide reductase [Candidatus Saccharibacteria bacterium 32-49-12]|nr:MAG: peptide-methionine (S)-S-oxide reductase [Candidatus Saccharibacteria bacterium 32-49-12]
MAKSRYVLAGGCFWCLEAVFLRVKGVLSVTPGYSGGSAGTATYSSVSSGTTKHAEVVKVEFDDELLPREVLLDIFFTIHDPTSLNRQGADIGPQYRSALFYDNEEQKREFESAISRAQAHWDKPIVTRLEYLDKFYEAEPEHHNYFDNNPANPYCAVVISPKINKAKNTYKEYMK